MAAAMPELRTPVMILVDVSWQEPGGVSQKTRACMEDKSAGGARIRVKTPIAAGSRLRIQWRFEQFAGIAKYCRREGREYVIGVQKAEASSATFTQVDDSTDSRRVPDDTTTQASDAKSDRVQMKDGRVLPPKTDDPPQEREPGRRATFSERRGETSLGSKKIEITPLLQAMSLMEPPIRRPIRRELLREEPVRGDLTRQRATARDRPRGLGEEFEVNRQTELRTESTSARKGTDQERKSMAHKWLGLAPWHNKQDDPGGSEKENPTIDDISNNSETRKSASAKENRMPMPQSGQCTEKIAGTSAREVPAFQVELLPMEDIYRTAGIVSPRKGYSVPKVVEMLNSEHIRGLSKETKRAALLMALDAAGITIEQVQRDGKARQNALDAYEVEQKKQAEAEWARKAEEIITHIQRELESIKAHYTARISRNMEALARDKARFNSWVTTKEQESQSMAEAVELCLKTPVSEPASVAPRDRPASAAAGANAAGSTPISL